MSKRSSPVARRAWRILRLALLWARKGGLLRNGLVSGSNILRKGLRKIRDSNPARGALILGDREFSFDETPIIHVKMHRPSSLRFKMPHIPCINPHVDFDYDFDLDEELYCGVNGVRDDDEVTRKSFLMDDEETDCDEEIDLKAEEFIANFYKQIKLQKQISFLEYDLHHKAK